MGISGTAAALSGGLALGGGIAGLLGAGNASNVQLPQMFQMPGMNTAAGGALSGIGGLGAYNTSNIPQFRGITQNLVNNPYAQSYQQGAGTAGGLGQLQALGQYGVGQGVTGFGMNQLAPYAGAVMNTAMDPQQALYNRTLQQVQDQTRAGLAATGVGTTPYGAGIEAQNLNNFNIDWQNNLLNRQIQGLGAAGGALGQAGQLAGAGQQLAAGAPGQYLQSSGIPYGTFGQIGQGQLNALTGLQGYGQGAAQIPQQQVQDYLAYIGAGNQAGGVANQLAGLGLQQNQQSWNQNLQSGQMLGAGLYGLGRSNINPWGNNFGNVYPMGGPSQTPFMQGGWGY